MKVLRNLFINVNDVRDASKIKNEEVDKRTNYLKRGGLSFTTIDKNEQKIFIENMKRMLAVIKAVNGLNINKKSYPQLDVLLGNVTRNKAYAAFSTINTLIDEYKSKPDTFVPFLNDYNKAIKTTEFANLKAEIEKNLNTLLEEAKKAASAATPAQTAAPKTSKKKTVTNTATPTPIAQPEYEPTQAEINAVKLKRPDYLPQTQDIVQLFKELFKLFRRVNEIVEKEGAGSQPKLKGQPTPNAGKQGQPAPNQGNRIDDPSQEVNEGKNKYSKKASSFIGKEISHLKKDKGYPQDRAVAAAINVAKDKGMKVGAKKK